MRAAATLSLDRIVVGADLADPSRVALEWVARELAPESALLVVHALRTAPRGFLEPPASKPSPAVADTARAFVAATLARLVAEIGRPETRIEIREGDPATVIATIAEEWGADLIVVGPHGGELVPERGVGTTAERLVRTSPIPVLVARGMRGGPPRRLLVPLDDVDLTPAVLNWAGAIAVRTGATVELAHVLDHRWLHGHGGAGVAGASGTGSESTVLERASVAARAWLAEASRALPASVMVERTVASGAPGEEILARLARADVDGVVMGRRGSGRVLPGVLGSTVSTVLRRTERPVLIVVDSADRIVDDWGTASEASAPGGA